MQKRLFTEKQVDISAFLAGPIPPGILIYLNYLRLGKKKEAYISLIITMVFTVLFFYALLVIPEEVLNKIPNIAFTAFYGIIVFLLFRYLMAPDVKKALEAEAIKASNWAVTGLTILGFSINLALIFGMAMYQPLFPGEKLSFSGNDIYYNQEHIENQEVEKLASHLFNIGYFGDEFQNAVHLDKLDTKYVVTIPVDKEFWADPDVVDMFVQLKLVMEVELEGPTDLKLEHYSLSGETEVKTI